MKKNNIGIITSKGGHLSEVLQLQPLWVDRDRFWVTFRGKDTSYYLAKEKKHYAHFPESRSLVNAVRNLFLAVRILKKERPTVLISCGAGIAVPFFLVGKFLYGTRLIYIESYDFIAYPSLTGKLLYNFVDLFVVQHSIQKKWYPKAKYWGSLF